MDLPLAVSISKIIERLPAALEEERIPLHQRLHPHDQGDIEGTCVETRGEVEESPSDRIQIAHQAVDESKKSDALPSGERIIQFLFFCALRRRFPLPLNSKSDGLIFIPLLLLLPHDL